MTERERDAVPGQSEESRHPYEVIRREIAMWVNALPLPAHTSIGDDSVDELAREIEGALAAYMAPEQPPEHKCRCRQPGPPPTRQEPDAVTVAARHLLHAVEAGSDSTDERRVLAALVWPPGSAAQAPCSEQARTTLPNGWPAPTFMSRDEGCLSIEWIDDDRRVLFSWDQTEGEGAMACVTTDTAQTTAEDSVGDDVMALLDSALRNLPLVVRPMLRPSQAMQSAYVVTPYWDATFTHAYYNELRDSTTDKLVRGDDVLKAAVDASGASTRKRGPSDE